MGNGGELSCCDPLDLGKKICAKCPEFNKCKEKTEEKIITNFDYEDGETKKSNTTKKRGKLDNL